MENRMTGTLYVVPTPIGNLEDMTLRGLRVLREVDFIAAEDTRHTRKLLSHYEIVPRELFSYHQHNVLGSSEQIVARLREGKSGALVSDAGMPGISDPGAEMIGALLRESLPYIVLPGASASLTALVGSGLDTRMFQFFGFFPRERKGQESLVERLRNEGATTIFYESPHRIRATLQVLYEGVGNRRFVLARELTKLHERYVRGMLCDAPELLSEDDERGEIVLILEGHSQQSEDREESLTNEQIKLRVGRLAAAGIPAKEAMRVVAKEAGLSRREVYQVLLDHADDEF
ncbi:16S rRNA (cytidine(1402)-2'-O)-methyltransferase [Ferroacidibacillus organovorans]|uniref:Ribosomal RNA small subunit methyltransferase I n=1 Tax=Ferroacidibacillus organovorans TaxID=1765683 RepID=A0A1V4EV97_9BACL|nr:16S rRNA (cytidine(1402)-2'-O)-methyltransferase [Ferroacidibacillus organovorans]OPG16863.1 16S rRNA (cytidine(1402)-2'-O)-methyltransferase [Ferroacidibacillus organovorans]